MTLRSAAAVCLASLELALGYTPDAGAEIQFPKPARTNADAQTLAEFTDLYSVHVFSKITVHGGDAILVCTGALLGIAPDEEDYQAVDRWVNQDHWPTKVGDEWKMIGGATHEVPALGSSRQLEIHPLFYAGSTIRGRAGPLIQIELREGRRR